MTPLVCHVCATGDDVTVLPILDEGTGRPQLLLTCDNHEPPFERIMDDPDAPAETETSGRRREQPLVHELDLYDKLAGTVEQFDRPVEYGIVEHHLAYAHSDDYRRLHREFGHVAIDGPRKYSLSSYLSRLLGNLTRQHRVRRHQTHGTGIWAYNTDISAWSPFDLLQGSTLSWAEFARASDIDPDTWPAGALIDVSEQPDEAAPGVPPS